MLRSSPSAMLGGAETVSSGKTRAETTTSREQQTADRLYLMELPKALSSEALLMLREGINMALSRWSALQMAVENEWGSRNSRDIANKLCDDVFVWFTHSKGSGEINDLARRMQRRKLQLHREVEGGVCSQDGSFSCQTGSRAILAGMVVDSTVEQLIDKEINSKFGQKEVTF
ncbi:uncharacterized protein LOC116204673 isoform X2 [Punica granatum]|uniref:Uncharacterized protein LOC116204673 isoform X2 n=1 Tax=Punica granatum TaxID=22663 RepID=A0A6P8D800_PUNGR|nr:uncharacterized protein LOC116204673 isoform X2 [Punica granatum]